MVALVALLSILEVIASLTKDEIVHLAASGTNRPVDKETLDAMSISQRSLLFNLLHTYSLFRKGFIGKEEGERLKANALSRFDLDSRTEEAYRNYIHHMATLWKEIEETGSAYRKNPSIENADAFLAAVYGVGRLKEGDRD